MHSSRSFFAKLILFGVALCISQLTVFTNSITITVTPEGIIAVFNGQSVTAPLPSANISGLAIEMEQILSQHPGLHHLQLTGGDGTMLYQEQHTSLFLFGRDWLGALRSSDQFRSLPTIGDWTQTRTPSRTDRLWSGTLPSSYTIVADFQGRGSKAIVLQGTPTITISVRDGHINNDYSVCTKDSCITSGYLEEATPINCQRILNILAELIILAAGILLCAHPFLTHAAPMKGTRRSSPCSWLVPSFAAFHLGITLWVNCCYLAGVPHIPDAATYLRQAILLVHGMVSYIPPVPDILVPFIPAGGRIVGHAIAVHHATHFWPLIIAPFALVQLSWLLNPLLSTVSILLLARITHRLFGGLAAIVAAGAASLSPFYILMGIDLMPHAVTNLLILGIAWACITSHDSHQPRYWVLAGSLFGLATAIRPMPTCCMGAPLLLYGLYAARPSKAWRWVLAGMVPVALLLLIDQAIITGNPFRSPYEALHGLSPGLNHIANGLGYTDSSLAQLITIAWGSYVPGLFLALCICGILICGSSPLIWAIAALPLFDVLGHAFIDSQCLHGYGPRYYFECFPALIILLAAGCARTAESLEQLAPETKRLVTGVLAPTVCLILLVPNVSLLCRELPDFRNYNRVDSTYVQDLRAHDLPGTVIITEGQSWQDMDAAASFFDPAFHRSIIVNAQQDNSHYAILARLADRKVFHVEAGRLAPFYWWQTGPGRAALSATPPYAEKLSAASVTPPESVGAFLGTRLRQCADIISWLGILEILSLLTFPFVYVACRRLPDRGWGLHKVISLLIVGYLTWIAQYLGMIQFGAAAIAAVVLVLALILLTLRASLVDEILLDLHSCRRSLLGGEVAFLVGFFLFVLFRALCPEIFWGEKPMDFTFLNYFTRLNQLPPQDPWAAGNTLRYYYFGPYVFGLLHKLSQIPPQIGYNLSMATIAGMFTAGSYSLLLLLTRHAALSTVGSVVLLLSANPETIRLWLQGSPQSFDLFWATTRLLRSPFFVEYPLWSFLFSDLHAHVIAIPLLIAAITLVLDITIVARNERFPLLDHGARGALLALCIGGLLVENSWDYLSLGIVALVTLCVGLVTGLHAGESLRPLARSAAQSIGYLAGGFILARLLFMPYLRDSWPLQSIHWGWVYPSEFNEGIQFLRHYGFWLATLPAAIITLTLGTVEFGERRPIPMTVTIVGAALLPLLIVSIHAIAGVQGASWYVVGSASALLAAVAFLTAVFSPQPMVIASLALVSAAAFTIPLWEHVFIMDRMNTLFKGHLPIWICLSTGTVALTITGFSRHIIPCWSPLERWGRATTYLIQGIAVSLTVATGAYLFVIMAQFHRVPNPMLSLDGTAFQWKESPDEAALFLWIRQSISGTPTILEAQGPSYREYTRVAMNTGLPTVLGWDYHVTQRGTSNEDVQARTRAIKEIYTTSNPDVARRLLRQYHVSYVVIGDLERRTYPGPGIQKFLTESQDYTAVFQSGSVSLVKVQYHD